MKFKVELLSSTSEVEYLCYCDGKRCYSELTYNFSDHCGRMPGSKIKEFLRERIKEGHLGVLEPASFVFHIYDISRVTSHQLVRHRVASYGQQSQRFVKHIDTSNVIIPDDPYMGTYSNMSDISAEVQEAIADSSRHYETLLNLGVPQESARYFLLEGTSTAIVVTMNARELLHFFALRLCSKAQAEIRGVAEEMLDILNKRNLVFFEEAGPRCNYCYNPCDTPYRLIKSKGIKGKGHDRKSKKS